MLAHAQDASGTTIRAPPQCFPHCSHGAIDARRDLLDIEPTWLVSGAEPRAAENDSPFPSALPRADSIETRFEKPTH